MRWSRLESSVRRSSTFWTSVRLNGMPSVNHKLYRCCTCAIEPVALWTLCTNVTTVAYMEFVKEVELDSRQRLPLARIVDDDQRRFRITRLPDGDYLLTPVVSISERELALLRNSRALESLQDGIDQAARGKVVRHGPGHFSDLAASLGAEGDED